MKKIFTLIAATLFTVAIFAADHKPVVTLKSNKNYEVVIDGQTYFTSNGMMNIANLRKGQHTIKVYEATRGFMFRKGRKLVDASTFVLRNNSDVDIIVGLRGHISITEDRFDRDRRNDSKDNDWDKKNGYDKKDDHGQGRDRNDIPRRF